MADAYPDASGHRGIDTSIAAPVDLNIGYLQRVVLNSVRDAGDSGRTTNEIVAALRIDRGSIQPRTSELRSKRLIADSGRRRPNANGKYAIVWTLPEFVASPEMEARHG